MDRTLTAPHTEGSNRGTDKQMKTTDKPPSKSKSPCQEEQICEVVVSSLIRTPVSSEEDGDMGIYNEQLEAESLFEEWATPDRIKQYEGYWIAVSTDKIDEPQETVEEADASGYRHFGNKGHWYYLQHIYPD